MKRKFGLIVFTLFVSVVFLATAASTASATTISFDLTDSNVFLGLPPGTVFGTVTLEVDEQVAEGDRVATFTVNVDETVLTPDSNLGIQKFYFNTDLDLERSDFDLPGNWRARENRQASEFGRYSWEVYGRGNSRENPLEFTVSNSDIDDVNNFIFASSPPFVAHIAGFDSLEGETSGYFGTAVPEPATLLLLGSGLIGLGLIGRRRFKL